MTFRTMAYSAHRSNIDELFTVCKEIQRVYGKKFVKDSELDLGNVNEIVRNNINLIMPEEGRKVARIIEVAKKAGVMYAPSEKAKMVLLLA